MTTKHNVHERARARLCVAQNECLDTATVCVPWIDWNTLTHYCSDVHYTAPDTTQSTLYSSRYYTQHIIQIQILHKAHYTAPDTTHSTLYSSRYYTKHVIQLQILHKEHYTATDTTQSTLYSSRYYTKHVIQLQILHKAHYTAPDTTQSTLYSSRYYIKHIIQLQILHKANYTAPDTKESTPYNSRYYTNYIPRSISEAPTMVRWRVQFLWDMTLHGRVIGSRRFEERHCLHIKGSEKVGFYFEIS